MKSRDSETTPGCATGLLAFGITAMLAAGSAARAQAISSTVGGTRNATTAVTMAAPRANRYFGAHPVRKVPRDRDGGRALPDDAIAAIQSITALPPYIQQLAPFLGNLTVVNATPGNALGLVRETDCSLNAYNLPYTPSPTNPYTNPASKTEKFQDTLHSAAGLTTTPDLFKGGCKDPLIGINSNQLLYAGETTTGLRTGVYVGYISSLAHGALYTTISQTAGAFVSATQQPIPATNDNYPQAAAAGDLNGDGNPDLISVNYGSAGGSSTVTASFTVLLGSANGTFTVGKTYTLPGNQADSVVIDDFNGDGKLDVVIPSQIFNAPGTPNTSTLSFFPGNGDGTFGAPVALPVSTLADSLVSGDFNGDGNKDLVAGTGQIFLGNGKGAFVQQSAPAFAGIATTSDSAVQLAVGDFNKDGKLDLAGGTGDSIYIFLGNGNGTFSAGSVYAGINNQGYLTATDLDGDGSLDLFSGDASAGILGGDIFEPGEGYALMGHGDGTFSGAPQVTYANYNTLEDLNGDGKPDFIGLLAGTSAMSAPMFGTYYGQGNGIFQAAGTPLAASPYTYKGNQYTFQSVNSYATADINGDGLADLVVLPSGYPISPPRMGFLTALGSAGGSFQAPAFTPAPSLLVGGGADQVIGLENLYGLTNQSDKFEILYSYETQDLGNSNNYYIGYAVQVSNGDGTFAAPALTVFSSSASLPTTTVPPSPVNIVDLNGDKIPDLILYVAPVAASGGTPATPAALEVRLGNSDGTFQAPQPLTLAAIPADLPLAVGDINGDGKVDLVALGGTANNYEQIAIALGKGDGTFGAPTTLGIEVLSIGGPTEGLALGDFNGDGKLDLAIAGYFPPFDNGIFPGNGDGTFQTVPTGDSDGSVMPPEALLVGGGAPAIAADINGDGKTDLVTAGTFLIQEVAVTPPVPQPSSTVLTASASTIVSEQSVTLTAVVTGTGGSAVPTGTVTFSDGSTSLGTGTLNTSEQAAYATSSLAVGTHSITAGYGGDTNFAASTSSAVTVMVTAPVTPNFGISLTPATASVNSGGTATSAISVTPSGGFSSQVSFACSGLPLYSTCSFSPATVTPSGTAAASTTLTLATNVATASIRGPDQPNGRRPEGSETSLALVLLGLSGLASQRRKWNNFRWCTLLPVLFVAVVAAAVVACGGGGSSGGGTPKNSTTPAGTSTVTVTATAGSLSKTATLTFTVQ
jgi:hypothetical protein